MLIIGELVKGRQEEGVYRNSLHFLHFLCKTKTALKNEGSQKVQISSFKKNKD